MAPVDDNTVLQGLIRPGLYSMLQTIQTAGGDALGLSWVLYWNPSSSSATSTTAESWAAKLGTTATLPDKNASGTTMVNELFAETSSQLDAVNSTTTSNAFGQVETLVSSVCLRALVVHLGAKYGDTGSGDTRSLSALLKQQVSRGLAALITYVKSQGVSKRSEDLTEFVRNMKTDVEAGLADPGVMPASLKDWMFAASTDTSSVMHFLLAPWYRLRYVLSFRPGDWNVAGGERDVITFHDLRYAELIVLSSMAAYLGNLAQMPAVKDNAASVNTLNFKASMYQNLRDERDKQDVSAEKVQTMFSEVRALSSKGKQDLRQLQDTNSKFERRRGFVRALRDNMVEDRAKMGHTFRVLLAWVAALVAVTVVAVMLIVREKYTLFMVHASACIAVVAAYMLIRMLQDWVAATTTKYT
jgi:hypothetical protein